MTSVDHIITSCLVKRIVCVVGVCVFVCVSTEVINKMVGYRQMKEKNYRRMGIFSTDGTYNK